MTTTRFYLMMALLLMPLWGQAQEKLFNKYSDMKDVKSIYISKAMLEMDANLFTQDLYVGKTKNLTSVRLLSTRSDKIRKEMLQDIHSLVKSSKYELIMKQKGTVSNSEFYVSRKKDRVSELIMVMEGAASLKFIYLEGNLTGEDVRNLLLYQNSSAVDFEQLPCWNRWDSPNSLGDLQDLEKLKALGYLDFGSLKGLESLMNKEAWKDWEKQMKDLQESLKDWDGQVYQP